MKSYINVLLIAFLILPCGSNGKDQIENTESDSQLIANAISVANASTSQLERYPKKWTNLLADDELSNWKEFPWPPGTSITETFTTQPKQWHLDHETKVLHCEAQYHSHLLTRRHFKNFVLHVEFRYRMGKKTGSNSGVFVRMLPNQHVMHQVELADTSATLFGGSLSYGILKPFQSLVPEQNGKWKAGKVHTPRDWQKFVKKRISPMKPHPHSALGQSRPVNRKPKGQWNTLEVTCVENTIAVWMNGGITAYTDQCYVPEGAVGLEAEGYPIDFRNLQIKLL